VRCAFTRRGYLPECPFLRATDPEGTSHTGRVLGRGCALEAEVTVRRPDVHVPTRSCAGAMQRNPRTRGPSGSREVPLFARRRPHKWSSLQARRLCRVHPGLGRGPLSGDHQPFLRLRQPESDGVPRNNGPTRFDVAPRVFPCNPVFDHQDIPVKGRLRSLYIIGATDRTHVLLDGFDRNPAGVTTMVPVGWVTSKVKVVPHFEDPALMCAMQMWEASDATWVED